MHKIKSIYIYPNTNEFYKEGGNDYIKNLINNLRKEYVIVNKRTSIGLLDVLFKINKYDILYFNWIEDLPNRRFGFLQIPILIIVLLISKILKIKIVWFVHNNLSHNKNHITSKRFIIWLMKYFANLIFSHSRELTLRVPSNKFYTFHHPIEKYKVLPKNNFEYDILIWGTVSEYKGVLTFVDFVANCSRLNQFKILIAGKFSAYKDLQYVLENKKDNITVINKKLTEDELKDLFSKSRYVLFTYNSPSVLSSAALCKTLSYGKEIIGPNIGSFKELGNEGLIYTYNSFDSLVQLLISKITIEPIDQSNLKMYIQKNGWVNFIHFLSKRINN